MIDYFIAIGWGCIGWAARVAQTYYTYSKLVESKRRGRFVFSKFRKKYDQDWVYGFFAMLMLSAVADLLWVHVFSKWIFEVETPYYARINVIIGFMAIYIVERLPKKSKS